MEKLFLGTCSPVLQAFFFNLLDDGLQAVVRGAAVRTGNNAQVHFDSNFRSQIGWWECRELCGKLSGLAAVCGSLSGNCCHQPLQLSIWRASIHQGIRGIFTLVFRFPVGSEWAEMTEERPNCFSNKTMLKELKPYFCIPVSRSFNLKAWKQTKWLICLCQADCCCTGTFVSETS